MLRFDERVSDRVFDWESHEWRQCLPIGCSGRRRMVWTWRTGVEIEWMMVKDTVSKKTGVVPAIQLCITITDG
jgi:hypothetical protein